MKLLITLLFSSVVSLFANFITYFNPTSIPLGWCQNYLDCKKNIADIPAYSFGTDTAIRSNSSSEWTYLLRYPKTDLTVAGKKKNVISRPGTNIFQENIFIAKPNKQRKFYFLFVSSFYSLWVDKVKCKEMELQLIEVNENTEIRFYDRDQKEYYFKGEDLFYFTNIEAGKWLFSVFVQNNTLVTFTVPMDVLTSCEQDASFVASLNNGEVQIKKKLHDNSIQSTKNSCYRVLLDSPRRINSFRTLKTNVLTKPSYDDNMPVSEDEALMG